MSAEILYWSMLRDSQWTFYIAATAQGLCFVGSPGQHVDELAAWSKKGSRTICWSGMSKQCSRISMN